MENQNEQLNPEQILIVGTLSEDTMNAVERIATDRKLTIIRLEDKVITDYLKQQSEAENKPITVDEFTANKENQKIAEEKALYLWNLMTNNATTDKALERIFTKSEVVNKTTLTNKTLGELLELLFLFGFIAYTKGRYEFRFVFGEETQKAETYADIIQNLTDMNVNIARYKNLYSEDKRATAIEELRKNIYELISL